MQGLNLLYFPFMNFFSRIISSHWNLQKQKLCNVMIAHKWSDWLPYVYNTCSVHILHLLICLIFLIFIANIEVLCSESSNCVDKNGKFWYFLRHLQAKMRQPQFPFPEPGVEIEIKKIIIIIKLLTDPRTWQQAWLAHFHVWGGRFTWWSVPSSMHSMINDKVFNSKL